MKIFFQKLIVMVLAFAAFTVLAAEPEDFLPADAPIIFRVNCNQVFNRLKDALQNADHPVAVELTSQFNIDVCDFFSGQAWGAVYPKKPKSTQIFIKTKLSEKSFAQALAAASKNGQAPAIQIVKHKNRNIYVVYSNSAEKFAFCYLADDVIMVCSYGQHDIAAPAGKRNELISKINKDSTLALCIDMTGTPGNKKFNVQSVNMLIDLQGAAGSEEIALHIAAQCQDRKTASQLAGMYQFALPMLVSTLLINDPELARRQAAAIKVDCRDNQMSVDYRLDMESLKNIIKYFSDPNNSKLIFQTLQQIK